jgi:hypothetical protein
VFPFHPLIGAARHLEGLRSRILGKSSRLQQSTRALKYQDIPENSNFVHRAKGTFGAWCEIYLILSSCKQGRTPQGNKTKSHPTRVIFKFLDTEAIFVITSAAGGAMRGVRIRPMAGTLVGSMRIAGLEKTRNNPWTQIAPITTEIGMIALSRDDGEQEYPGRQEIEGRSRIWQCSHTFTLPHWCPPSSLATGQRRLVPDAA